MRVSLEQYGTTVEVGCDEDDLTLPEVVHGLVVPVLRAAGFLESSIAKSIPEDYDALERFYIDRLEEVTGCH